MESFKDFTADWDWGFDTDRDTSIKAYLTRDVVLATAAQQALVAGVKAGQIPTTEISVPVVSLIPTQTMVSQRKVMAMLKLGVEDVRAPIVTLTDRGFFLLDGHHRVCAAVVNQERTLIVKCVWP